MSMPNSPADEPQGMQPPYVPGVADPNQPPMMMVQPIDLPPPDLDEHLGKLTPYVWVTYVLAAINLIVFIVMIAKGVRADQPSVDDLVKWGGNVTALDYTTEPWRLFTSCFIHSGFMHIGMNLFGLLLLGQRAERMVGPWGFLLAYIASGLVGSIASSLVNQHLVSVGASGAIFGIVGLQLSILLTHPETPLRRSLQSAWTGMLVYLGYNLFSGFTTPGIDNAAHLGGLAAGALCGLVLSQRLEPESLDNRWWRNAVLAIGAVLVIGGGFLAAKSHFADSAEWNLAAIEFDEVQPRIQNRFNSAVTAAQAGTLDDRAVGRIMDEEVLPPWRAIAAKLHAVKAPSGEVGERRRMLLEFVDAREQAWAAISEACKETDPVKKGAKFKLGNALMAEAETKVNAYNAKFGK